MMGDGVVELPGQPLALVQPGLIDSLQENGLAQANRHTERHRQREHDDPTHGLAHVLGVGHQSEQECSEHDDGAGDHLPTRRPAEQGVHEDQDERRGVQLEGAVVEDVDHHADSVDHAEGDCQRCQRMGPAPEDGERQRHPYRERERSPHEVGVQRRLQRHPGEQHAEQQPVAIDSFRCADGARFGAERSQASSGHGVRVGRGHVRRIGRSADPVSGERRVDVCPMLRCLRPTRPVTLAPIASRTPRRLARKESSCRPLCTDWADSRLAIRGGR